MSLRTKNQNIKKSCYILQRVSPKSVFSKYKMQHTGYIFDITEIIIC